MHRSWPKPAVFVPIIIFSASAGIGFILGLNSAAMGRLMAPAQAVKSTLKQIFEVRARPLFEGNPDGIDGLFDAESTYGRWAFEHETRRLRYVQAWIKTRRIALKSVRSSIGVRTVDLNGDRAWIFLVQTLKVKYIYLDDLDERVNLFGIGTRHTMELVNKGGKWLIRRDWYTDPLEEDALVQDAAPAQMPEAGTTVQTPAGGKPRILVPPQDVPGKRYDRKAAITYANKYAGLALSTSHRYNLAYRDYTNTGGDCTNFVSQVLADKDGGRLSQDYTWAYLPSQTGLGNGSKAWTQAPVLVNHLLNRGHARLVGRGSFADLIQATADLPCGAVGELREGDVIAYEEKGRIEHLAMVAGRDLYGYPVVNSHTADRYHVPWDLGWDKRTVFWFLQIKD